MSRVTNSVLLRFGITQFWSSSLFTKKNSSLLLTVNVLLTLVLKNYFLQIIKSQYSKDFIKTYVFKLKRDKFSFIEKYLFLKNIKDNGSYHRKNYSLLTFADKNKKKIGIKKLSHLSKLLFFSCLILNLSLLKSRLFFSSKLFLILINSSLKNKKVKKRLFIQLFVTKRINYYLKLKFLGYFISNLIFNYVCKDVLVSIKSVTESVLRIKLPFFFQKIKNNIEKKYIFFNLFLSFLFFNAKILSFDISKQLTTLKNKKHINTLSSYLNLVKIMFLINTSPLKGLKVQVAGRLNGKLRKSRYGYFLGSIKQMTFENDCNFVLEHIYTQYGIFSLKIWYFR